MGVYSYLLSLSAVVGTAFALPAPDASTDLTLVEKDVMSALLKSRAESINYNQNYIAGGANVQYSPNQGAGSFSINYNTQQDFVCGLGWQPGNSDPITYSGSFSASGVGILTVYGWTTNPLIEYYIMETSTGYPKSGQQKGTLTSDGGTYEIWQHQQTNQPSIQGTSTFQQYISIRQSQRSSGTVTVANHFNAWKAAGMNMGTMNYQVMAVESWSGSGSGTITLSKNPAGSGGSTGGGGTVTTSAPSSGNTGTGGGTSTGGGGSSSGGSAQWGQCGGNGWTGPTTCVSPYTCKYNNAYYSQCM